MKRRCHYGWRTGGTHAQALAAHPQVELVAGSSRDEGRRTRFQQRLTVRRTYADWREMLRAEALDIVKSEHKPRRPRA